MTMEAVATHQSEANDAFWAPGTVQLNSDSDSVTEIILHPTPSTDPDDPLNWSNRRKALNLSLLCFYVLWTFVQLNVGFAAWDEMQAELGFSTDQLNVGAALNYGGLAVGCLFFMPFVHKFGRRPIYILSSAVQLASVVWLAKTETNGDLIGSNLISGLAGAISETLVEITIADVFFVHQRGTMIGAYLMCMAVGAFLGPVASGYIIEAQGWRWTWWWCVIFMSVNLVLVLFLFEESKYVPKAVVQRGSVENMGHDDDDDTKQSITKASRDENLLSRTQSQSKLDHSAPRKTYVQRMALVSPSPGTFGHHFYQPVIVLFTFPAVAYTAITYGIVLSSFAVMTSVQATYLVKAPYNFGASGVGLMNIAPFIGAIPGMFMGGYLTDKFIMWLARRNRGVYEPEMRLWFALLTTFLLPAGILMFGLGLVRGIHWAGLAFGLGLFGFAFVLTGDVTLAYITDCYQDIIGDALVAVVFFRNIIPLVALLVLTPWIDGMGVQGVHILIACVIFGVLLVPILFLMWGKKARTRTATKYRRMALRQPVHRATSNHQL